MTSRAVSYSTKKSTGHGEYQPRASQDAGSLSGEENVYVNNQPVIFAASADEAIDGSKWKPHVQKNDTHGRMDTQEEIDNQRTSYRADATVFVNGKPISRVGDDVETRGKYKNQDGVAGGSENVFVGDNTGVDLPTVPNIAIIEGDDDDAVEPGSGASYVAGQVSAGRLSSTDLDKGSTLSRGSSTTTTPRAVEPATTDTKDIQSIKPFPSGDAIDAIVLSTNYTVGKLTRSPSVTFDNPLRGSSAGLSIDQIVANLKLLAVNVIEPIKAKYPNAFVTNTFRPAKAGATKYSQHNLGQACDIQFRGIPKSEYYNIALWVKDNVPYDQLLLEYKTTGSGLPWIHVSFKTNSRPITDPTKIMTFLNDSKYAQGLVQLS